MKLSDLVSARSNDVDTFANLSSSAIGTCTAIYCAKAFNVVAEFLRGRPWGFNIIFAEIIAVG